MCVFDSHRAENHVSTYHIITLVYSSDWIGLTDQHTDGGILCLHVSTFNSVFFFVLLVSPSGCARHALGLPVYLASLSTELEITESSAIFIRGFELANFV